MKTLKFCCVYVSIMLVPGIVGPLSALSFEKCLLLNYSIVPFCFILTKVICKYMRWDNV